MDVLRDAAADLGLELDRQAAAAQPTVAGKLVQSQIIVQMGRNIVDAVFDGGALRTAVFGIGHATAEVHRHCECQLLHGGYFGLGIHALAVDVAQIECRLTGKSTANGRAGQQRGKADERIFLLLQGAGTHAADFTLRWCQHTPLQKLGITCFNRTANTCFIIHRHMKFCIFSQFKQSVVQICGIGYSIIHKEDIFSGNLCFMCQSH